MVSYVCVPFYDGFDAYSTRYIGTTDSGMIFIKPVAEDGGEISYIRRKRERERLLAFFEEISEKLSP